MQVSVSQQGKIALASVSGTMAGEEADKLADAISNCIRHGLSLVVLDLSEVAFIDSESLECLLELASELGRSGGDLRITGLNDVCRDIFAATRVDNLLTVYRDKEEALRSLL